MMISRRALSSALLYGGALALLGRSSPARAASARNVVLVHGAYADGSSWSDVIALLQHQGINVTAVQNPLTSLADDAEATRRGLHLARLRLHPRGDEALELRGCGGHLSIVSHAPQIAALILEAARGA